MDLNYHYLLNNVTQSHIYFLNIAYNSYLNVIELQVTATGGNLYTAIQNNVSLPKTSLGSTITNWTMPSYVVVPGFQILTNGFQQAIGFNAGNYPSVPITNPNAQTIPASATQAFTSAFTPGVQPLYIPIYYKPNNSQFAQQGGVTASSFITRKRYNTITCGTNLFRKAYGLSVDSSVAYGVAEYGYTIKDKLGYPNTTYPVIPKYGSQKSGCVANLG